MPKVSAGRCGLTPELEKLRPNVEWIEAFVKMGKHTQFPPFCHVCEALSKYVLALEKHIAATGQLAAERGVAPAPKVAR